MDNKISKEDLKMIEELTKQGFDTSRIQSLEGPQGLTGVTGSASMTDSDGLSKENILILIDQRINQAFIPIVNLLGQVEKALRHPQILEEDREKAHQKVKEFNDLIKSISNGQ